MSEKKIGNMNEISDAIAAFSKKRSIRVESNKDVLVFETDKGVWIDLLVLGCRTDRWHFKDKTEAIKILERALKQIKELYV